jgi:hypothetical protein
MRSSIAGVFVSMALLIPNVGTAQVFSLPSPSPDVNAANADWQIRGEPIFHAGSFYYPAGPTVFFDGRIMVRTGVYNGIPLYADVTIEPYSIVFVPIGRNVMRPYERRREGELAGTVGSRPPSFPIQRDGDLSVRSQPGMSQALPVRMPEPEVIPEAYGRSRPGVVMPQLEQYSTGTMGARVAAPAQPQVVNDVPRPTGNDGVWIEFEGARWFSAGPAVTFNPDRFVPSGSYRGFVVYRDTMGGRADTIFVTVVPDGPVAPYRRR